MVRLSSNTLFRTMATLTLGLFLFPAKARALAIDYPLGTLSSIGSSEWPAGLPDLVNTGDRVGGYWINQCDFFFYRGDVATLNDFLDRYGLIPETPLTVILHTGRRPTTGKLGDKEPTVPYDWSLEVMRRGWGKPHDPRLTKKGPGYVVTVHVWISDEITLDRLDVPAHVNVESADDIKKFIERHRQNWQRHSANEQVTVKPPLQSPLINPQLARTQAVPDSHQAD